MNLKITITEPMPFKAWVITEAERSHRTVSAIHKRYYRGRYKLKLYRKNQRVITVLP